MFPTKFSLISVLHLDLEAVNVIDGQMYEAKRKQHKWKQTPYVSGMPSFPQEVEGLRAAEHMHEHPSVSLCARRLAAAAECAKLARPVGLNWQQLMITKLPGLLYLGRPLHTFKLLHEVVSWPLHMWTDHMK